MKIKTITMIATILIVSALSFGCIGTDDIIEESINTAVEDQMEDLLGDPGEAPEFDPDCVTPTTDECIAYIENSLTEKNIEYEKVECIISSSIYIQINELNDYSNDEIEDILNEIGPEYHLFRCEDLNPTQIILENGEGINKAVLMYAPPIMDKVHHIEG